MKRGLPSTLAVVVLAHRGGAALVDRLAGLDWADERAVLALDPGLADDLPSGVARLAAPEDVAQVASAWVLLVGEDESIDPAGARAVREAVGSARDDEVFGLRSLTTALDLRAVMRGTIVRLAGRQTPIVVRPGLRVEFARGGRQVRAVDAAIVRARGETLSDAVAILGAEAGAVAALVDGRAERAVNVVWQPLVATVRTLAARAVEGPLGLGRWVLAVLEGYRVVVTYAKLWERRRDHVGAIG